MENILEETLKKQCRGCNEVKDIILYPIHRFAKDGYENYCKVCSNERQRKYREKHPPSINKNKKNQWQQRLKDGFYTLYYLPNEEWIGMSIFPFRRLQNHKADFNRNIDGFKCIYKFVDKKDAEIVESLLHKEGYNGYHPKHMDFRIKLATSYHTAVKNKILSILDGKSTIS